MKRFFLKVAISALVIAFAAGCCPKADPELTIGPPVAAHPREIEGDTIVDCKIPAKQCPDITKHPSPISQERSLP